MNLYPGARLVVGEDCGPFLGGLPKTILHSTEGDSAAGAIGAFHATRSWPHFTYTFENGVPEVYQHMALNVGARALEHRIGTCETNSWNAVQIEIVGFAAQAASWPIAKLLGLARLLRWIEQQNHVPAACSVDFHGEDSIVRLSESEWLAGTGIYGHQHVPNQDHWDPGPINVALLLPRVNVQVNGADTAVMAFLNGGKTWVSLRSLSALIRRPFTFDKQGATFDGTQVPVVVRTIGSVGYVEARDVPVSLSWDAQTSTVDFRS